MCQLLLSGVSYVSTPNVHSDVWDSVESYTIHMLKLIIAFLVQLQHLLVPSLIVTSSQVRVSTPLPLLSCCIFGLGPEGLLQIKNYCATLHVVRTSPVTFDPHPDILNVTNNSSALSWTHHTCKRSKIGQMLAHFFCSLLINSPLGINSQCISTNDNKIADDISRLKKQSDNNPSPAFDYTILKQTYPELRHCSFFQIQPELISLIWDIVLTKKWPNHKEVQTLKQRLLGKLTTLSGPRSLAYQIHVVTMKAS